MTVYVLNEVNPNNTSFNCIGVYPSKEAAAMAFYSLLDQRLSEEYKYKDSELNEIIGEKFLQILTTNKVDNFSITESQFFF